MHNYTTYLFDFDYTLVDSSRGIVLCYHNVLNRHGYTHVSDEAIKRTIGKTLEESFTQLTGEADAQRLAEWRREYVAEADQHMTANTVLFPETLRVLQALKASGAKVGIVSTKYRYRILELTHALGLADNFFDIIVGGEDVQHPKPSPEGLLMAIERLQADKQQTLYVGDSTVDAATARSAGVPFAAVLHGVTTAHEFSSYPHRRILSSLDELLAPHPTQPRLKKRINLWQVLLLLLLGFLSVEELDGFSWDDEILVFPLIFLLLVCRLWSTRRVLPVRWQAAVNRWLHPLNLRRRAFHIHQIRGRAAAPLNPAPCTCQNCGHTFSGNFCPRCGQGRQAPRFRLKDAPGNILRTIFRVDGRFARTLIDLVYRPGYMMRDFIRGRRINHTPPLAMVFLLTAFYMLTVQLIVPGLQQDNDSDASILPADTVVLTKQEKLRLSIAELEEAQRQTDESYGQKIYATTIDLLENQLQEQIAKDSLRGQPEMESDGNIDVVLGRLVKPLERMAIRSPFFNHVWSLLKSWGHGNKALHILLTLPLFAVATQWAFYRRKKPQDYNLMEALFVQAYVAAQLLLLSIPVVLIAGNAHTEDFYELPYGCIFLLFCWDYQQLYARSWWSSFWKTVLMFTYSGLIIVGLAMLGVALLVVVRQMGIA